MTGEFAGRLRERITLTRPLQGRAASGRHGGGWENFADCFAAIEPLRSVGGEEEAGALSHAARFRVLIRHRPGVEVGQRVAWSGRLLAVRRVLFDPTKRERLELQCEEMRA